MGNTVNLINLTGTYTLSGVCSDGHYLNKTTMTVESVVRKVNEGKITFLNGRTEFAINKGFCSKLILSILNGYPIEQLYIHCDENNVYKIFNGEDYVKALSEFINNKQRLKSDMPPIRCVFKNENGENFIGEYDVSGKKFQDLPEVLQDIILWYNIDTVCFHSLNELDDRMFNDMLFSIIGEKTLKPYQKVRFLLGSDRMAMIKPILDMNDLWGKTPYSKRLLCIMRSLILISGYKFHTLSAGQIMHFIDDIDKYTDKIQRLVGLFQWLETVTDFAPCSIADEIIKYIPYIIDNIDRYFKMGNLQITTPVYSEFLIYFFQSDDFVLFSGTNFKLLGETDEDINEVRDIFTIALKKFLAEYDT